MNEFDDEMCFMVSLYGTALDAADIVPLIGDVDELFCAAGQPPSHLSVLARGFNKKPLLFDNAWKRLQKAATEDLRSVTVYSFIENWQRLADWTTTCNVFAEAKYFQLGASLATMPDAEQQILAFTRRWLARIRPAYGIGFFRTRGRGPNLYGMGVSYGRRAYSGPEYEESRATCRWLDGMHDAVYNDGVLRDVYPYNLLNTRQLEYGIDTAIYGIATDTTTDTGDRSLRAWIQAEPWRGRLSACQHGLTLWTVTPEHIPEVRRVLTPSGVLFVRRPEHQP